MRPTQCITCRQFYDFMTATLHAVYYRIRSVIYCMHPIPQPIAFLSYLFYNPGFSGRHPTTLATYTTHNLFVIIIS